MRINLENIDQYREDNRLEAKLAQKGLGQTKTVFGKCCNIIN